MFGSRQGPLHLGAGGEEEKEVEEEPSTGSWGKMISTAQQLIAAVAGKCLGCACENRLGGARG